MKKLEIQLLTRAAALFIAIAFSTLSLEYLLFNLSSDFNIYRVLDISARDFCIISLVLAAQYYFFRKIPLYINKLWKTLKTTPNQWLISFIMASTAFLVYSFLSDRLPAWVFFFLLLDFIMFTILINRLASRPLPKAIFLLLFAAAFDTAVIFWMHEEANAGRHISYARQLSEERDTLAENYLFDLAERLPGTNTDSVQQDFWEKQWLETPYLASNYRFEYRKINTDSVEKYYQPIQTIDDRNNSIYKIFFPANYELSFRLKKDFKSSVYTDNIPYKQLDRLNQYQFAVVDNSEIVLSNSHNFDLNIFDIGLPPVGQGKKTDWNGFDVTIYHHSPERYILIGESLSEIQVLFSNFAFFFSLLIIVAILFELLRFFTAEKSVRNHWKKLAIQVRIQATLIGLTVSLFFVIAATTFYFLNQNNHELAYERHFYIAETVRKAISEDRRLFNWSLEEYPTRLLAELANRKECEIDIYNANGQLINSSIASGKNSPAPKRIDENSLKTIEKNTSLTLINPFEKNKEMYLRSLAGVFHQKQLEGFVAVNIFESEIGTAQDIPIIMSKLLNVYVLLLLGTWGIGLLLINLLTQPLGLLATRLSNFKPGKQNDKLSWEGEDAIGQLIGEYNKMVDVVEQTTKELAKSEREDAWQIMSQQIAHEINNQLTPLRLKFQFLNRMLESPEYVEPEKAKKTINGLVEQVDKLTNVATQFQLFAKLHTPEAESLLLRPYIERFFADYSRKADFQYDIIYELKKEDQAILHIAPEHLEQILRTLLQNAEDSIPEHKAGLINLRLKKTSDELIIEVEDNGMGIDASVVDNIFDPKFSTSSSNIGLGLPICKRIVELYEGKLTFTTSPGKGTCFHIVFPVQEKVPAIFVSH